MLDLRAVDVEYSIYKDVLTFVLEVLDEDE